jgi:predicted nucleic acid-binding protein
LIVDTDVLICYLRGHPKAKAVVEAALPFSISAVTYMELVQGMRNKTELQRFQKTLKNWDIKILHLDNDISMRALFYVQEYALSHSMMMADALIAATAIQHNTGLITDNDKHYRFIAQLQIQKFTAEK